MTAVLPVDDPLTVLLRRWVASGDVPADWAGPLSRAEPDAARCLRRLCAIVRRLIHLRTAEAGEEAAVAAVVLEHLDLDDPELVDAVRDVIVGLGGPAELAVARVARADSSQLFAAVLLALVALASPLGPGALRRLGLA